MTLSGRPLRFLALVLGGWTALRIAVLLPEAVRMPELIAAEAAEAGFTLASLPPRMLGEWPQAAASRAARPARPAVTIRPRAASPGAPGNAVSLALLSRVSFGEAQRRPRPALIAPYRPPPVAGTAPVASPATRAASRFSGSAWLSVRGDGDRPLGPGGQLGGSQAGVRLRYELGDARRLALSARLSSPLKGPGKEVALGVEWRPTPLPIAVIAEHRISLDGGGDGPALMAVGGVNPTPLGAGFDLEAYAQAGAVHRGGRAEPFADGAVRIARPVARIGSSDITLGAGAWGGAQRGAQRLDLGPTLAITLPIADRGARLSLDWRQRVAGRARPGSGIALTLGSDF